MQAQNGLCMGRKHISWKTKCAATLAALNYLRRPGLSYDQIKELGEKRFLKLWHFDHAILHESEHANRDEFWNLTPMLIPDHREKTRKDAAIIAKGRRLRAKQARHIEKILAKIAAVDPPLPPRRGRPRKITEEMLKHEMFLGLAAVEGPPRRKLRSRGFDKRFKRKMDGTTVRR